MELYFCDLCQEAVPQADLDAGRATHVGQRTVCRACHAAMGPGAATAGDGPAGRGGEGPDPSAGALSGDPADARAASGPATGASAPPSTPERGGAAAAAPRPRTRIGPGLAATLAVCAILLSLAAAVMLLVRIELLDRAAAGRADAGERRVERLEERVAGTRSGAVAAARDAADSAVVQELRRLDSIERQLRELRALVAGGGAQQVGEPGEVGGAEAEPEGAGPRAAGELVLPGDAMERVDGLEEQLLFLQARVHDLLEAEGRRAAGRRPVERLELPEGEVGQLVAQLGHEDPIERVAALYGLALVEDPGIAGHVTPLLRDRDAYVRALSARILEQLEARSAVQPLIDALADPEVVVREAAVAALRHVTARQFGFDPRGPSGDRYAAARRWREWWSANWKSFLYGDED
jgi:hypothetical protein